MKVRKTYSKGHKTITRFFVVSMKPLFDLIVSRVRSWEPPSLLNFRGNGNNTVPPFFLIELTKNLLSTWSLIATKA